MGTNVLEKHSDPAKSSPDISRKSSRYLMALLKFEPERRVVMSLVFGDEEEAYLDLALEVRRSLFLLAEHF